MARTVSALVPYYGAKRQMAKTIAAVIGRHRSYLSPFCGSLAVEFAKLSCPMEVVNDLNENLTNLIRVVRDDRRSVELFERLFRTAFSEDLYADAACYLEHDAYDRENGGLREHISNDLAYNYFVVSWMGRNGFVGSERELETGFCKRFTSKGGDPAARFRGAVEGIPSWWHRIRNMTVLSECGIGLVERFEDNDGAVIYADPPYLVKGAKYLHDFTAADHRRLAEGLRRFKNTRVIVSYYEHPDLADLYPGWFKTVVEVNKNIVQGEGAAVEKAPEVLLTNFEVANPLGP
jgi:DNA adenine methylase